MARYKRKRPERLAEKLLEVRLRLELTQQQVADELETDVSSISRFEHGEREPSLLEILKYSYMSGVGIDVLIDDKKDLAKKRRR